MRNINRAVQVLVAVLAAGIWMGQVGAASAEGASELHVQILVADQVPFGRNQSAMTRGQIRIVDMMADWLKRNPGTQVTVRGHADVRERKIDRLSQARAEAVRKRLVRKGIQGDRLKSAGMGTDELLGSGTDNQRVDFYVIRVVSFTEEVGFKPGSAVPNSTAGLDQLAARMKKNSRISLRVVGYVESSEGDDPAALRQLSTARAQVVRDALVKRGVPAARLKISTANPRIGALSRSYRSVRFYIADY